VAVADDSWVLKTAEQLKLTHADLPDWQILQMARDARVEIQQLMVEWDAIHNSSIDEISKIGRRAKFDQLFESLKRKFGAMVDWDNILKRHPPQQGSGASSYIYNDPRVLPPPSAAVSTATVTNFNTHSFRPMSTTGVVENPIIIPGSVVTLNQNHTATPGNASNPILQNLIGKPGGPAVSSASSTSNGYQNQNGARKRRIAHSNQNGRVGVGVGATPNLTGMRPNGISPSPYQPGRSDFSGRPLGTPYPTPTLSHNDRTSRFQELYNRSKTTRPPNSPNTNNSARAGTGTGGQGSRGGDGSMLSNLKQFGQNVLGRFNPSSMFSSQENQVPAPTRSVINTRPVEYVPPSTPTTNGQSRGLFGGPETILP